MAKAMKRKQRPTLSPEEARAILPRRHRRWSLLTRAANQLAEKMKPVKKDVRACLAVLPEARCEAADVRSHLVEVVNVEKKNEANIALLQLALSRQDFERCCPRAIDLDELRTVNADIVGKLHAKTSTRLEIDFLQEPVARGA